MVDYVFCTNNFPQISKIDYYRLHAGLDHSAIRISFKLPRYIVSKKRKKIVMDPDVSLDLARQGLRILNENIDKHKEHEVADRLWETLCDSKTQKRQKKKAKKYQWYDNSVRELKKSCQAAWFRLKLNVHQEFTPKLQETYKIAKSSY